MKKNATTTTTTKFNPNQPNWTDSVFLRFERKTNWSVQLKTNTRQKINCRPFFMKRDATFKLPLKHENWVWIVTKTTRMENGKKLFRVFWKKKSPNFNCKWARNSVRLLWMSIKNWLGSISLLFFPWNWGKKKICVTQSNPRKRSMANEMVKILVNANEIP